MEVEVDLGDGCRLLLAELEADRNVGSWVWEPTSGQWYWSDNLFRLLGLEPQAFQPTKGELTRRLHPDDQGTLQEDASAKSVLPRECRLVCEGGRVQTFLSQERLIKDASGVVRVAGTLRRQSDLRFARALLEDTQAIAHLGSWIWDPATGAIEWSRELYRIMGVASDVVPTVDTFDRLVHPDDLPGLKRVRDRMLEAGATPRFECRIVRPDGVERRVKIGGRPILPSARSAWMGIVHDVTDRRELEGRLLRAEASGPVESVNQVAHDFRNVLTVVLALADAMYYDQPSEDAAGIIRAVESGNELIERMLRQSDAPKEATPSDENPKAAG